MMENSDPNLISVEPIDKNKVACVNRSASSSSNSEAFDDNSSLSVLDLNTLPDARKSVSLIHVNSKCSSIGSWLDHCFTSTEAETSNSDGKPETSFQQLYRSDAFDIEGLEASDVLSVSEMKRMNEEPLIGNPNAQAKSDSDDSNNSFEFNEDDLDIDIIVNDDDAHLDDTLTASHDEEEKPKQSAIQTEFTTSNPPEHADRTATTFDFLKGLGLAGSYSGPFQPPFKSPAPNSYNNEGGPTEKLGIDSMYFAKTSMHSLDGSLYDTHTLNDVQQSTGYDDGDVFGEDVSDGKASSHPSKATHTSTLKAEVFDNWQSSEKMNFPFVEGPQHASTTKTGAFDDWQCDVPLDFSGMEFNNQSKLHSNLFDDDEFAPADEAKHMLDDEEQYFQKQNQFMLDEDFVAPNAADDEAHNFSTCRSSAITVQGEDGKVSIGAYMAKRSDKLGGLDGLDGADRPSFGLKVRTPSPQKPCKLMANASTLATIQDESSSASSSSGSVKSEADSTKNTSSNGVEHLLSLQFDDTVDQSMMTSLSKAISDMSSSMNNEDLAQFIIAISKQKLEAQKKLKKNKSTFTVFTPDNESEASVTSTTDANRSQQSSSVASSGVNASVDDLNSTLKNDANMSSNASHSKTLSPRLLSRSTRTSGVGSHADESSQEVTYSKSDKSTSGDDLEDDLPPLPDNTLFSPMSVESRVLSSTRANLSLRGSLSRDSIEQLHKNLRAKSTKQVVSFEEEFESEKQEQNTTRVLSISSSTSSDHSQLSRSSSEKDLARSSSSNSSAASSSRESIGPLSQSSPETRERPKTAKFTHGDLTRLSAAFQHLLPNSNASFNELATLAESEVDLKQILNEGEDSTKPLDFSKKRSASTIAKDNLLESVDSKYELSSVEQIPKASSTRRSESEFNRSNRSSRSTIDNVASSRHSSSLSMPGNSFSSRLLSDGSYPSFQSVASVMPGPPVLQQRGYVASDPHLYQSLSSNHPLMQVVPSTMQPLTIGQPLVGDGRSFGSAVYTSRSYPTGYSYPHVIPYPPHSVTPTIQSSCGFPGPLPDSYYEGGSIPSVNIPKELSFDNSLCVGVPSKVVLPIENKSARWIQVELRTVSVMVNRQVAPLNNESYIMLKNKHVIGPHSVEHTDVTLTGHEPGRCAAIIEVISHLIGVEGNQAAKQHCSVATTVVTAECETASVSLSGSPDTRAESRKQRLINFGEIVSGSSKSLPIRVLNQSKVEVPVRLVLFSSSQDSSCFSLSFSSNFGIQKDKSDTASMCVLRTVLAVSDQPFTIWLHFQSPDRRFASGDDPIKVEGRIEVILDAPFKSSEHPANLTKNQTLLDSVGVCAVVGEGKLHAPKSRQMLAFSAARGSSDEKLIPVKNAGNISIQVAFTLEAHSDIFTVKPSTAVLSPGRDIELTVKFKPNHKTPITSDESLTNMIFMNILPSGPQFEVRLTASVTGTTPAITGKTTSTPPSLLTNKTKLRWGAVAVGKSRKQKLMLRSGSQKGTVTFRCSIKADDTSSFQILSAMNGSEELTNCCDMSISPGQDQSVYVVFVPTRSKLVNAKLEIKTPIDELPSTKFTIPLSGYGGVSMVQVDGLEASSESLTPLHNDNVPECYSVNCNNEINEFKVSNCGTRAAFIKLVVYSDSACQNVSSDLLCAPTQFILQERQSRTISVECKPGKGNSSAIISLWHSDELSRLLFKKALSNHTSPSLLVARCVPQSHVYLRSVSFDRIFDGEGSFVEEDLSSIEPHSYDVQMFFMNIKQTMIMVKQTTQPDVMSNTSNSVNLSCQDLPERDTASNDHLKKPETHLAILPPYKSTSFKPNWDVTPTHITVTLPPATGSGSYSLPEPTRVKIKNQSMASLSYDIVWPGHYLTITPNRGRVEPESVAVLLISANPSLASSKDLLPWCGQAMVLATSAGPSDSDNSRTIYIQIKENPISQPSKPVAPTKPDAPANPPKDQPTPPKLIVSVSPVEFTDVTIGNSVKSYLEFRNMSKTSVKWILTSLGPSYVKNPASGDIFKSTYAAFVFSRKSGVLEPGARVQLPATFNPMNVGMYLQHWELEYYEGSDDAALSLQREKVQLQGQGIKPQSSARRSHSASRLNTTSNNDIFVSEECFWFPDTVVGKSSMIKVPIKNKGKRAHTVKFINLRPPFYISHQKYSIRSMCCANLPITFKPTHQGTHSGTLVVQTDPTQPDIQVVMKAQAVAG